VKEGEKKGVEKAKPDFRASRWNNSPLPLGFYTQPLKKNNVQERNPESPSI